MRQLTLLCNIQYHYLLEDNVGLATKSESQELFQGGKTIQSVLEII